jgi:hypothetical protein
MKTKILAALSLCLAWGANAQLITGEGLTGAAIGAGLGAVIGHSSGHHSGEGAAIGAGAGFVLGSLFHDPSRDNYAYSQPAYGYNTYPGYYSYPVSYSYARPNYAVSGAALGAIGGAIIGHSSGHHSGEGAAIGAGAGFVLGSIAEENARRREINMIALPYTPPPQTAPQQPQLSDQVPSVGYTQSRPKPTSMSSANALFGR